MNDTTVIYYTSNREDPAFEKKIQAKLLESTLGIPIISVSQKPIDLGYNICIGDVGISDKNILKQLLIGCETADTKFIATAEADCVYPPSGYFDYVPNNPDILHRNTNLWIMQGRWTKFQHKPYSLCAQVAGREYMIRTIKDRFKKGFVKGEWIYKKRWAYFRSALPVVNMKTKNGLRRATSYKRSTSPETTLPYWGSVEEFRKEYLHG
jgi:hypothetical protein